MFDAVQSLSHRAIGRAFAVAVLTTFAPIGANHAAKADDFVVTASSAPSFGPGLLLASDAEIKLSAGQTITLLGPTGPVEVSGPFSGSAAKAAGASASANASPLANLVERRARLRRVGAFRGKDDATAAETLFDPFADQAWCVDGGPAPTLFVAPRAKPRVIALETTDGARAEILWPADAATAPWPSDAPYKSGVAYRAFVGDVELGAFALVAGPSGGDAATRLQGLLDARCLSQAETVLAEIESGG